MPSKTKCVTIDGPGIVQEVDSRQGRTYLYVKGNCFEGWYSSTEITSDIGDPGRVVTKPADFPDADRGTRLPYDPEPRDMFHEQLNIQPTADLPENLTETDSIDSIKNYEPNAVFGNAHPFGKVRNARHASDVDTSDDEDFNEVVPDKGDDDTYDQVPAEWDEGNAGLDDYGDDYEEKNGEDGIKPINAGLQDWWLGDDAWWLKDIKNAPSTHDRAKQQGTDSETQQPQRGSDQQLVHADINRDIPDGWNDKASDEEIGSNFANPDNETFDGNFDNPDNNSMDGNFENPDNTSMDENFESFHEAQVIETRDGFCVASSAGAVMSEHYSSADEAYCARYELALQNPMTRQAAWNDVRKKAIRLRSGGAIKVTYYEPKQIEAEVNGDTGYYDVGISRKNAFGNGVTYYNCSCPWGQWAFKRQYKYVGRFCSHGYAAYMEMQSLDNSGAKAFNDARNPFVSNVRTADAMLNDNSSQFLDGGSSSAPAMAGEPVLLNPSHGVQPDGQMEVYSPQVMPDFTMNGDPEGFANNPGMQENHDHDAAGALQNFHDEVIDGGQENGLEGVPVPHQPDGDMGLEGMPVAHDPMGGQVEQDLGFSPVDQSGGTGNMPVSVQHMGSNDDLADMAQQFLAKTAAKQYDLSSQEELMNEQGQASQVNSLNLSNSLYEEPNVSFLAL